MNDLEKARNDRTGFLKYSLEKEHKKAIYQAIVKMMEVHSNSDEGCTYAALRRTYTEAKAHLMTFEKQLGFDAPASNKK